MKMMKDVIVKDYDGNNLMPTARARARKLIKKGRAEILEYRPFTIRLLQKTDDNVQLDEQKTKSV